MATRGTGVTIPSWWLEDMHAAIAARKLTRSDLAKLLLPPDWDGDRRSLTAARVQVMRFLDDKHRTLEIAEKLGAALGLSRFTFTAGSRDQAKALELLSGDPAAAARTVAVTSLVSALESGEYTLDEILRQNREIASGDDERRGRGGGDARPKDSKPKRR